MQDKLLDGIGLKWVWTKAKSLFIQKKSIGSTLIENDGIVDVKIPTKETTKANFANMSDEEKKGLVVVTDDSSPSGGKGEVYSTDEIRIGTWIDGKPLYRKCYYKKNLTVSAGRWSKIANAPDDLDSMIKIYGSYRYTANTGTDHYPVPNIITGIEYTYGIVKGEFSKLSVAYFTSSTSTKESDYICIIEYTKTTD